MSLNGLDGVAVIEAYQAALAEAGGWFLLKYVSRDTVELLGRGTGGVSEARLAVEKYEEKSPLYGLVQYRRRKVILKYVPEGTSRLLQARLAVQFQSILETFAPHETVFTFKTASEINEAALASACTMHTSATSLTSDSSSSLRKSRLGGIAEDIEEGTTAPTSLARNAATAERPESSDTKSSKPEKVEKSVMPAVVAAASPPAREDESARKHAVSMPPRVDSLLPPRLTPSPASLEDKASVDAGKIDKLALIPSPRDEKVLSVHSSRNDNPSSPTPSFNKPLPAPPEARPEKKQLDVQAGHHPEKGDFDYRSRQSHETTRPSFDHRQSTQTLRPQADDTASQYSSYSVYKPKKKLGPRPHKDTEGRPKTSGVASKDQRAVSNLPPNLRISNRVPSATLARPGSQHSSRSVPSNFRHRGDLLSSDPAPPLPPAASHVTEVYKSTDAGSFLSATALNPQNPPTITPEKLRLMRALQMRKKQQALAKRASALPPSEPDKANFEYWVENKGQVDTEKLVHPVDARAGDWETRTDGNGTPAKEKEGENEALHAPTSNVATGIQSPAPVVSVTDHLGPDPVKVDVTPPKEPEQELPIKKDSGIASVADVETPTPDPSVFSSTLQHAPKVSDHIETSETKPVGPPAVFANGEEDSKATESQNASVLPSASSTTIMTSIHNQSQPAKSQDKGINDADANHFVPDASQADTADRSKKRRNLVEPIKVLSSPEASDASDDDDSFIEELQHAKLEQAKPMSVARSPITPIFKNSSDRLGEVTRAASAPMQPTANSTPPTPEKPRTAGGRSASSSTALPPLLPIPGDGGYALVAKKGTVSSGITTRIKALESFSRRDATSSPPQTPQPQPISQKSTPSIWSFRKRTSPGQSKSSGPNASTAQLPQTQLPTPQATPTPEQTLTSPPPLWRQRTGSATKMDAPMQKGDSISVTARIVRDPNQNPAELADKPLEPAPMNLHRSPLTVEHERSEPHSFSVVSSAASTIRPDSRPTSPKVERNRISFSSTRSSMPRLPTSDSMASRMSQASNHKKKTSGNGLLSPSDASSIGEDRPKESKTSRLMKRMSNLTGGSRRNIFTSLSPNGREQVPPAPIAERRESLTERSSLTDSLSHVVDIGDVNIQFPDTLLWKRRFMRIDDQGYLVLTPPTKETMERNRGISRRFHLNEFKRPTLPDPEREELPWSILLDFEDGTCLQCACESRYAQTQVLRMLVDAHNAYRQLYLQ